MPRKSAPSRANARKPQSPAAVKRPSGAAKPKPLAQLSPAYRARLSAYARKHGVSLKTARSAARGHKPVAGASESQLRRSKEETRIDAFCRRQAMKFPGDADELAAKIKAALMPHIRAQGMGYLRRIEAEIEDLHARYVKNKHRPLGLSLTDLMGRDNLPPEVRGYH